jgi:hypothetical protein
MNRVGYSLLKIKYNSVINKVKAQKAKTIRRFSSMNKNEPPNNNNMSVAIILVSTGCYLGMQYTRRR